MKNTDKSIRRICIASIKRHIIQPINYPLTTIFETELLTNIDNAISATFDHEENELPIAMTYLDKDNWTFLTTKKIISNIKSTTKQASTTSVVKRHWNDFKGYKDKRVTSGYLTLDDNTTLNILIETGKASMIIIYGIITLTGQETSTEGQIDKTLRRYQNRGFFDQTD